MPFDKRRWTTPVASSLYLDKFSAPATSVTGTNRGCHRMCNTKIGLFDKGRLMGLTRLSDDDITEELPNQLLLLKETLCCNLDLRVIKQCGCCCALDDWHWISWTCEFLLFCCSFSCSWDPLTCNHLQKQMKKTINQLWGEKIATKKPSKKDPTTKKIIKGQRWRTLASERCEEETVCADGCLFHRGGQKQETNWSCWQQLGAPPSQSSPFHYHPACCSWMMMLPQVEEEQQQQEQPVWPFPTTCSKLSQGRIRYPPLFLLLLSFFFSIPFGNSEEIFFLQL